MEILNGNKLIAEYLGAEILSQGGDGDYTGYYRFPRGTFYCGPAVPFEKLEFHSSWDALMPVWSKIKRWGMEEYGTFWKQSITKDYVEISFERFDSTELFSDHAGVDITAVWKVVVSFIEWYNNKNNYSENA